MRVVVLGAGFGGLELTTRLSDEFRDAADVVLIDQADGFIFGFSKLDVMFGRTLPDAVHHPYRDFVKPGVQFVQATVTAIDPDAKRVETDAGDFDAAEEALHDAFTAAVEQWARDGAGTLASFSADGTYRPQVQPAVS